MKIAEIYKSIQGEGRLTGTESVFVRTSGCNLRCWFCDTPYASWHPEGQDLSVDEIIGRCDEWDTPYVVITGGEPMLFSELVPLCDALARAARHVTVETAGTLYLPLPCDLMSVSPKFASSAPRDRPNRRWRRRHEATRHAPHVVRRLIAEHDYQIKFVVDTPADLDDVEAYLVEIPQIDRRRVMLMPQGTSPASIDRREAWLAPHCRTAGLTYCPRRQIQWFGAVRGT
jgi:7-carboxy-7-deazaguanine synthase